MKRRSFLLLGGSFVLAGVGALGGGYAFGQPTPSSPALWSAVGRHRARPAVVPAATPLPYRFSAPHGSHHPLPRVVSGLPGDGNLVAITVDDGHSSETVAGYARWVRDHDMRVTFFLNGSLPAWTENVAALTPLIASGHVQLGNHTWSHIDLLKASDQQIVDELSTNHDFIVGTFGVDARPYFRPPYGRYDDRVLAAAASVGYTTCTMWYGSFTDSGLVSEAELMHYASAWLLPQHVVIGHANFPTVVGLMPQLTAIMRDRGLQPVTLTDVFER